MLKIKSKFLPLGRIELLQKTINNLEMFYLSLMKTEVEPLIHKKLSKSYKKLVLIKEIKMLSKLSGHSDKLTKFLILKNLLMLFAIKLDNTKQKMDFKEFGDYTIKKRQE